MSTGPEIARRRTFAIISHPDAGKTTLTEKLLLFAGAIQIAGSVKARKASRHATSDWMEIEKQRGISVASSVMQMEYRDCVINLLDTPGHQDFSEDTFRVLTAVDAALMVIDAANGVEAQTLRLLDVCRARGTPILTFVNKMDREVREPLDLMDEIERVLGMSAVPFTWPVGMGKRFHGVYDLRRDRMRVFRAGAEHLDEVHDDIIEGLDNPISVETLRRRIRDRPGRDRPAARRFPRVRPPSLPRWQALALVLRLRGEQLRRPRSARCAGRSGTDSGDRASQSSAPSIRPKRSSPASCSRSRPTWTPAHRDRIAFVRVCSGRFDRGMRLKVCRNGKELRPNTVVSFLSQRREIVDTAYAGDIIGIPNHGTLQLGDTLTEGEDLQFTGLPYFAPESFQAVEVADPLKIKQLRIGLQQLGEEGAIQVFKPADGSALLLGAVGQLQFEVVVHRLKTEYGVAARLAGSRYKLARWITCDDPLELRRFIDSNQHRIAYDVVEAPAFMAAYESELRVAAELAPKIKFHALREHAGRVFQKGLSG